MPSRRVFIHTLTGTAAALAMGHGFPDADAQGRRGGQGPRGGQAPQVAGPITRREVQVGGRRVRVVDVHAHATVDEVKPVVANTEFARNAGGRPLDAERIQEMDRRGIDVQALSINGYWWYAVKDRALADNIVRAADDGLAAWCKQHPTRFVALTSPSMQFPNLKIVAAHGGGYLPSYLGRTEVACQVRANAKCANKKKPSAYFKDQIMIDAMVFSPEGVRHLVEEVGPTQVVYGTDIPLVWPDSIDNILAAKIPDDQKEMVLGGNLTKLLKLPS